MYLIILAAGQGKRLKPVTDTRPKCQVEVAGKPILEWQLSVARAAGFHNIAVVTGYLKEQIDYPGITYFQNDNYDCTNMVETLWCAQTVFGDGFVVSYGDILYEPHVLKRLLASEKEISVVVDQDWQLYWQSRFDNVLDDAETLRLDDRGRILNIGQKPKTLAQIQGQYIGLTSFNGKGVEILRSTYQQAHDDARQGRQPLGCTRPVEKLYMTDILQGIIDSGHEIHQAAISRGWIEVDSLSDLELAQASIEPHNEVFKVTA